MDEQRQSHLMREVEHAQRVVREEWGPLPTWASRTADGQIAVGIVMHCDRPIYRDIMPCLGIGRNVHAAIKDAERRMKTGDLLVGEVTGAR